MKARTLCAALAFAAALALSLPAAAAAPSASLDFTVAVGNTPTLDWSCPAGTTSAQASGSWSGSKAISGTETVASITTTASYTITCTTAADTQALLTWSAPTQNTDGSALTDLAGFRVYHGTSPTALTMLQQIASPSTLSLQVTGLAVGTHYFAVTAYNAQGVESAKSGVGNKTIMAPSTVTATVTIKVPNAPTAPTVQ